MAMNVAAPGIHERIAGCERELQAYGAKIVELEKEHAGLEEKRSRLMDLIVDKLEKPESLAPISGRLRTIEDSLEATRRLKTAKESQVGELWKTVRNHERAEREAAPLREIASADGELQEIVATIKKLGVAELVARYKEVEQRILDKHIRAGFGRFPLSEPTQVAQRAKRDNGIALRETLIPIVRILQ